MVDKAGVCGKMNVRNDLVMKQTQKQTYHSTHPAIVRCLWLTGGAIYMLFLQEYKIPTAKDIPADFRVELLRDAPNPFGVLGAKGRYTLNQHQMNPF